MLRGIIAGLGILVLILDTKTALYGAQEAVDLCLKSLIPSIFPFLILSGVLMPVLTSSGSPLLRPLGRLLKVPAGMEGLYLVGLLGGYPTGAQLVSQAYTHGRLIREDARRMLAFCSNAGPSFLFGVIGARFPIGWMLWLLWGIHILSSILTAVILPGKANARQIPLAKHSTTFTESLKSAVKTMGYICGWVIFFRVLLAFLDRWVLWLLPISIRVVVYGFLELANGCCALDSVSSLGLRFVLSSGMLAFGGVCVLMQTSSVVGTLGLTDYLKGKGLQALFSLILSYFLQFFLLGPADRISYPIVHTVILAVLFLVLASIAVKMKIRGRNPVKIGV